MLEIKNIDRVFQENLKDFEINPSKHVWRGIELYLTDQPVKRSIPLWQRVSGVAVIFILFFMGGTWYYNSNSIISTNSENIITELNFNDSKTNTETFPDQGDGNLNSIVNTMASDNARMTKDKETAVFVKKPNNNVIVTSEDISSIYKTIDSKYVIDKSDFLNSLKTNKNSISNIDPVNVKEKPRGSMKSKWSIGTSIAPVYYNTLRSGSPISEDLSNNSKSSDNALSVGLKLNYQINRKFDVQSGVNKVELAYITNNVSATATTSKIASNNNITKSGIVLSNTGDQGSNNRGASAAQGKSSQLGELNQSIEYFELPVEMVYKLYESKFGIGLVGGFSTYVLSKNSVFMVTQDQITDLGGASNLNNVNFSGNLGVDFDYKINKNWYLNVAPMFKYQLNTYSNSAGNFQPYYFGIYSGLNYRF